MWVANFTFLKTFKDTKYLYPDKCKMYKPALRSDLKIVTFFILL